MLRTQGALIRPADLWSGGDGGDRVSILAVCLRSPATASDETQAPATDQGHAVSGGHRIRAVRPLEADPLACIRRGGPMKTAGRRTRSR